MRKTLSTSAIFGDFTRRVLACHKDHALDFLQREAQADAHMAEYITSGGQGDEDEDEDESSYIMQVVDGVAIVEIKGRLTNVDRPNNKRHGLLSYAEIQRAYAQIAADDSIKSIIEDYDTPGGSVAMMAETEQIMRMVGQVKPRHGFVGSMSASAGYYLMCGCKDITVSSMAEVGSIGVMQVVADMVKMYEDVGISLKVIKSGDLKAAGNPFEKLTEDQEKYLSDQVQYLAGMFFEAVSTDRKIPLADFTEAGIGSGRTFIGQQALRVGLVDSIGAFTDVMIKLANQNKSGTTAPNSQTIYSEGVDMKKRKVVAPATVAAIEAGLASAEASVAPDPDTVAGEAHAAAAEPEKDDAQVEAPETGAETETAEGEEEVVPEPEAAVEIAALKVQLATAKTELKAAERAQFKAEQAAEAAEAKLAEVNAEREADAVVTKRLVGIVGAVTNNMNVALGNGKVDFSGLSGEEAVAKYEAVKQDFSGVYLSGGVTGSVGNETAAKKEVRRSGHEQAQLESVGF